MHTKTFKPNPKSLTKLRLSITILALLILAGGILLGWLMSFDREIGTSGFRIVVIVTAIPLKVDWTQSCYCIKAVLNISHFMLAPCIRCLKPIALRP